MHRMKKYSSRSIASRKTEAGTISRQGEVVVKGQGVDAVVDSGQNTNKRENEKRISEKQKKKGATSEEQRS
jgi:hypothetical protein